MLVDNPEIETKMFRYRTMSSTPVTLTENDISTWDFIFGDDHVFPDEFLPYNKSNSSISLA